MKRRNITLRGQSIFETRRDFHDMKEKLRQKFIEDEEALGNMIKHLMQSGFNMEDIHSYNTQAGNSYRPAVEAFLFNNEHVIDQVFLSQGMYTGFRDTAADPNYALRHKGQTELILRRLTPGDLLLLQCGHVNETRDSGRIPVTDQANYWKDLWHEMMFRIVPVSRRNDLRWLFEDLNAAAAAVMTFSQNSMKYVDASNLHLYEAFLDPSSQFYCGMVLKWETRREGDDFKRGWFIDRVDNRDESRAMFCCVLAAYGIDNYARACLDGLRTLPLGDDHYTIFTQYLCSLKGTPTYFKVRLDDGNQETQGTTTGNHSSPQSF